MVRNFEVFKPLDFLAQVTQHIPNRSQHLIRYYGYYSNKSRGVRKKAGAAIKAPAVQEIKEYQKLARRRWAALIKKVYEVDPLIREAAQPLPEHTRVEMPGPDGERSERAREQDVRARAKSERE